MLCHIGTFVLKVKIKLESHKHISSHIGQGMHCTSQEGGLGIMLVSVTSVFF